ncbi:553_t:CDS:1, partial [Gigaspora margarita]
SFADIKNITEKEKQFAIDGLLAIHTKGVKHGDIRLENIVIERNELTGDSNVRWIDFAWSKNDKECKSSGQRIIQIKTRARRVLRFTLIKIALKSPLSYYLLGKK